MVNTSAYTIKDMRRLREEKGLSFDEAFQMVRFGKLLEPGDKILVASEHIEMTGKVVSVSPLRIEANGPVKLNGGGSTSWITLLST